MSEDFETIHLQKTKAACGLCEEHVTRIAIEGCPIECGTRMMQAVLPGLQPEVHLIPKLTRFDPKLFSIREMPENERKRCALEAAEMVYSRL